MSAFSTEFGVCDEVEKALETLDWMLPTDVQSEACPLILGGGDVLMAAETGSGKTGAFCIPVVQIVLETLRSKREGNSGSKTSSVGKMLSNIAECSVSNRTPSRSSVARKWFVTSMSSELFSRLGFAFSLTVSSLL